MFPFVYRKVNEKIMLIYVLILLLIAMYSLYPYIKHNSRQSKRIFLFLSFATMSIVLGLRGEKVGEDTSHYLLVFECADYVKWSDMLHSKGMRTAYFTDQYGYTDTIENGFLIIAKIIHWFTSNGQIFLLIMAVVTCFLFAKFIFDNCEKVVFPTFVFLCESMFMMDFNGIRQILAVAIAIQSFALLKKKKYGKVFFVILIAALIHNVALVCLVIFPIVLVKPKNEPKSFKYAIIATIVSPFVIVLGQEFIVKIFPRYRAYFSMNFWDNSLGGTAILWGIEFALILVMYSKKFRGEDSFKLSCLILMYLACEVMGLRITMFSRVGWFFRPYLMLFFPRCQDYFTKRAWKLIEIVLGILLFLLYISYARTPARNYSFFWE